MNNETLLVIFVGLTGFALLVQAIVMLAAFLTMRKTVVSLQSDVHELRASAMPIIEKSRDTLEKLAPKIESVSNDVSDVVRTLREQTHQFQLVAGDVLDRVHRQTSRVDNMFTGVVDSVEHASNVVVDSVARPVRQVSALLAGAKAFLGVLATGRRRPGDRVEVTANEDMFV
jgi:methyl-accepting chemotaxis protein